MPSECVSRLEQTYAPLRRFVYFPLCTISMKHYRTLQEFEQQWGAVLNSVQQTRQPLNLDSCDWPAQQWGLVTTRAVAPGDALVTVPRQAILRTEQPQHLVTQIALLAMHHTDSILDPVRAQGIDASEVHMNTDTIASNPLLSNGYVAKFFAEQAQQQAEQGQEIRTHQQNSTVRRDAETVPLHDDLQMPAQAPQSDISNPNGSPFAAQSGNSNPAEATQQNQLLAGLVRLWLSTDRLPLSWTAQLASANLCRGHPQHAVAQAEWSALSGKPTGPCIV